MNIKVLKEQAAGKYGEDMKRLSTYNLGVVYEKGLFVDKDIKEALKWYEKSAKIGHLKAIEKIKEIKKVLLDGQNNSCDEVVDSVIEKIKLYSLVGHSKRNGTLYKELINGDKGLLNYLQDVQKELIDAVNNIEAAIAVIKLKNKD